jgi:hypothetical protein
VVKCQIGWIDSFGGEEQDPDTDLDLYYKKMADELYKDLREDGLEVEVVFDEINEDEADYSVYVRWETDSLKEFARNVEAAICCIPDSHAYDVLVGPSVQLTEDDFELAGELLPETREQLARLFPDDKTSVLYWDCECEKHYIHAKKKGNHCPRCGTYAHSQPDSHKSELGQYYAFLDCAVHVPVIDEP